MHIVHLTRAENELLASLLEDELRFDLREDMRGAIILLRQSLLPLQHFTGEANDHVVIIGLPVNRDRPECGAFDFHGLTLVPSPSSRLSPRRCGRPPLNAIGAGHCPFLSLSCPGTTGGGFIRRRESPACSLRPGFW